MCLFVASRSEVSSEWFLCGFDVLLRKMLKMRGELVGDPKPSALVSMSGKVDHLVQV